MLINTYFKPLKTVANSFFLLATCFLFSQDCKLVLEGKVLGIYDNAPLEAAVFKFGKPIKMQLVQRMALLCSTNSVQENSPLSFRI